MNIEADDPLMAELVAGFMEDTDFMERLAKMNM